MTTKQNGDQKQCDKMWYKQFEVKRDLIFTVKISKYWQKETGNNIINKQQNNYDNQRNIYYNFKSLSGINILYGEKKVDKFLR